MITFDVLKNRCTLRYGACPIFRTKLIRSNMSSIKTLGFREAFLRSLNGESMKLLVSRLHSAPSSMLPSPDLIINANSLWCEFLNHSPYHSRLTVQVTRVRRYVTAWAGVSSRICVSRFAALYFRGHISVNDVGLPYSVEVDHVVYFLH